MPGLFLLCYMCLYLITVVRELLVWRFLLTRWTSNVMRCSCTGYLTRPAMCVWCKKFAHGWESVAADKDRLMCCFNDRCSSHSSRVTHTVWMACVNKCLNKVLADRPMMKNKMWMSDIQTGFTAELSMFIFLVLVTHNGVNSKWWKNGWKNEQNTALTDCVLCTCDIINCCKGRSKKYRKWPFLERCRRETP